MKIKEYLEIVSKPTHEAGGGSVASLNGLLAVALILKAYNMINKNDNELVNKLNKDYINSINNFKKYFEEVIVKDGEAFGTVIKAFKLPKNTKEEKLFRSNEIQKSYKIAMNSPYELMKKFLELYEFILELLPFSDKMYNTELEVASNQILSGIRSAKVNVLINLEYIKDEDYRKKINKKLKEVEENNIYNYKKILEIINSKY